MEYQEWMLDDKCWYKIPVPYKGWNYLAWYLVSQQNLPEDQRRGTQEQIEFFDYTFACMMQKEIGWNQDATNCGSFNCKQR